MSGMFYPKLAFTNIRKNAKTYLPYMLTCIFTIAMYYIMKSLSLNDGLNDMLGASTVAYTLELGSNIIAIFAIIFLFYTNSFLTKNRKKEFGLFNILGMEKKHIAKVMGFESLYTTLISLTGGFIVGILLDKLMYVAVSRLIKADISLSFYISERAILSTLILFGILFFLIFLNSLRLIHLSKPIELLKGGSIGEKEPKAKWILALLGAACLATGYYIAVTVKNPIMALSLFFIAVILVIIGTYMIFTSGSIAFLKILKKNKRYYYKTNHFISISGMMYRMKQNAVGLANICVLSTMVLVMVSATASLIIGTEDIILERYPYQISLHQVSGDQNSFDELKNVTKNTAEKANVKITNEISYSALQFMMVYDGNDTFSSGTDNDLGMIDNVYNIFLVPAEDYSAYIGKEISLADDEVIFWYNRNSYDNDHFNLMGKTYKITEFTDDFLGNGDVSADICPTYGIVVKDLSLIKEIDAKQKELYGDNASNIDYFFGIDIEGDSSSQKQFADRLESALSTKSSKYNLDCRASKSSGVYSLYGSLFFLGIFLGLLFTMATVLIIYYKQISEGIDDKKRFEIMQKVGMSEQEVKGSIRSQVLTVFFMPLIVAGIHAAFAFPLVRKILAMLQLTNVNLYVLCTIGSFLVFALIYALIYTLTSKVYYKIIKK